MKLEGHLKRKKISFDFSKRNVKLWLVCGKPVLMEWNLNEREPRPIENDRSLLYHAEGWNGVLEYVNNIKGKVVRDVEN
jgi:hypothetical protein